MSENTNKMINCLLCDGKGFLLVFNPSCPKLDCPRCNCTGQVPAIHAEWREKGEKLRDDRRARRVGHHEECKRYGINASELSEYEQGWRNPDELIARAAIASATGQTTE